MSRSVLFGLCLLHISQGNILFHFFWKDIFAFQGILLEVRKKKIKTFSGAVCCVWVSLCAKINLYTSAAVVAFEIRVELVERKGPVFESSGIYAPLASTAVVNNCSQKACTKYTKKTQTKNRIPQNYNAMQGKFICIAPFSHKAVQLKAHKTI